MLSWGAIPGDPNADGWEIFKVSPTFKGWDRIAELRTKNVVSKTAFMAMQFRDKELDSILEFHIRPSMVAQTGYRLARVDDRLEAGLIDNRMRVEIRNSRFVIADLTHDNRGAYWEQGTARA